MMETTMSNTMLRGLRLLTLCAVCVGPAAAQFPPPNALSLTLVANAAGWQVEGNYVDGPFMLCGFVALTADAPSPLGGQVEIQTVGLSLPASPLSVGLPIPVPTNLAGSWTSFLEPGTYSATLQGLLFLGPDCVQGTVLYPIMVSAPPFVVVATASDVEPLGVGFWKTHPDAWPVTQLTIAGIPHDAMFLMDVLHQSVRGRAPLSLTQHLIAARLNIANGCDASIAEVAGQGDQLLLITGIFGSSSKADRQAANRLKDLLEAYNEGR
jgi:hypothetical protein